MNAASRTCLLGILLAMSTSASGLPQEADVAHAMHAHAALDAKSPVRGAHLETGCIAASQQAFDQGFYFLHNMSYTRARDTFEAAAAADPSCAMLSWGVAMTMFQPL